MKFVKFKEHYKNKPVAEILKKRKKMEIRKCMTLSNVTEPYQIQLFP